MALPIVRELTPAPDPVSCAELLSSLPFRVFLDSAARGTRLGRYSFLTADPVALVRSAGGETESIDLVGQGVWQPSEGDALDAARRLLGPWRFDPIPGLPPFQGGAAGYLAYEWGRVLEDGLPRPRFDDLGLPDVVLGLYDWVLAWDHGERREIESSPTAMSVQEGPVRAWLISTGLGEGLPDARTRYANGRANEVLRLLRPASAEAASVSVRPNRPRQGPGRVSPAVAAPERAPSFPVEDGRWAPKLELRSSFTHTGYLEAVARVREYILDGDIFQANLSQRFEAPLTDTTWAFYRRLRERNAAPFAGYLEYGDFTLLSASPERFVRVDQAGLVQTRPIKGTRPRGVGPEHDAALGQALSESDKDRAENLMIVDLMRNDLSRVCQPGTVRVEELFALERYASVHHLVSTVAGQLASGLDAADLLRAAFPGGSITGAPKIRAMEIISELEPSTRGAYCGSIGYWSLTGALDMNIAIRTAVARDDRVYFNAGGGVVFDSDPEREYRETLDKARGIIDALMP